MSDEEKSWGELSYELYAADIANNGEFRREALKLQQRHVEALERSEGFDRRQVEALEEIAHYLKVIAER